MAETVHSRLTWRTVKSGKQLVVSVPTKGGGSDVRPVGEHHLSPGLRTANQADADVEILIDNGRVVGVRVPGETWMPPTDRPRAAATASAGPRGGGHGGQRNFGRGGGRRDDGHDRDRHSGHDQPQGGPAPALGFHNPYNFIPAVTPKDGPLGQHAPCGHDRYYEGRWSGRICITITTATPLLIPDAARATSHRDNKDHLVFGIRKYRDEASSEDRPYLPPTSLKGTLRSAYEAVTNSRMGVFTGHEDRLAYRMDAGDGLSMVPARLGPDGRLYLYKGTTPDLPQWDPGRRRWLINGPMYAAWLRRYKKNESGLAKWRVKYPDGADADHGDEVLCWLQLVDRPPFEYWRVVALDRAADGNYPDEPKVDMTEWGKHKPTSTLVKAKGWIVVTNHNIANKHDERVFFVREGETCQDTGLSTERVTELRQKWSAIVDSYHQQNKDKIESRQVLERRCERAYGKNDDFEAALSRQICSHERVRQLRPGDLCYARVSRDGKTILGLYPVMIGREIAPAAPDVLLSPELHPAQYVQGTSHAVRLEQLSPADRVFGWANQKGGGAWRGQLRIGPIACTTKARDAIENLGEDGLPLAILSTAKPQQARFYVAKNKSGDPQDRGISKADAAYADDGRKSLRGRKVFPHHRWTVTIGNYWDGDCAVTDSAPEAASLQAGGRTHFREYRRRPETAEKSPRDDQNRSITEWVKPGTVFTTWLDVINLSREELGALLWLLSLDAFEQSNAGHFHRLGGGKPLGFGSVKIEITGLDVAAGEGKKAEYLSLRPLADEARTGEHFAFAREAPDAIAKAQEFVDDFTDAIEKAYADHGTAYTDVPFIKAFLRAARGFDDGLPIHYPRASRAPDPAGKNYEWFVENEKLHLPNRGHALANVAEDERLPYWSDPS